MTIVIAITDNYINYNYYESIMISLLFRSEKTGSESLTNLPKTHGLEVAELGLSFSIYLAQPSLGLTTRVCFPLLTPL